MSSLRDKLLALADTGTDQAWLRGFHRRAFAIECARLALEEAARECEQHRPPSIKIPEMMDEDMRRTLIDEGRGERIAAEILRDRIRKLAEELDASVPERGQPTFF